VTGLSKYFSGPYPRVTKALASSTANDMSCEAFVHAMELAAAPAGSYAERLDRLRERIRRAYRLEPECRIVFAPSGTDLEYVALAAAAGDARAGIHNVLLGADEVGSGCRLSANGMYFARVTGCGVPVTPGERLPGLEQVSLVDVPVRCARGLAHDSKTMAARIRAEIDAARAAGRRALVHVVHGSKTGLILPELPEIDRLLAEHGSSEHGDVSLVVDACQARITSEALHAYLARGAIVFLTGSKFMGGPPFSGFALVPPQAAGRATKLPAGLAQVFRRAEWPEGWPGRELLAEEDNHGLWLRLEAAIFELERFQRLPLRDVERTVSAFQRALTRRLVEPFGLNPIEPFAPGHEGEAHAHPIEMRTLATIDVSGLSGAHTFDRAQQFHRSLALAGLRLGQPVRSVRNPDGGWAGTIRIGPAMPQIVDWARLDDAALAATLDVEMAAIADALVSHRYEEAA
jgi:selenocysteine lyase/cysteine desulfurase